MTYNHRASPRDKKRFWDIGQIVLWVFTGVLVTLYIVALVFSFLAEWIGFSKEVATIIHWAFASVTALLGISAGMVAGFSKLMDVKSSKNGRRGNVNWQNMLKKALSFVLALVAHMFIIIVFGVVAEAVIAFNDNRLTNDLPLPFVEQETQEGVAPPKFDWEDLLFFAYDDAAVLAADMLQDLREQERLEGLVLENSHILLTNKANYLYNEILKNANEDDKMSGWRASNAARISANMAQKYSENQIVIASNYMGVGDIYHGRYNLDAARYEFERAIYWYYETLQSLARERSRYGVNTPEDVVRLAERMYWRFSLLGDTLDTAEQAQVKLVREALEIVAEEVNAACK